MQGKMMKIFKSKHIFDAYDYVENGGVALHLFGGYPDPKTPLCFLKTKVWGHLLDNDKNRLIKTAKELGVKKIKVSREGIRGQHIDLCGKPLQEAIERSN